MSFNGSGTFVINSSGQPVVANTVISSTVFNALTADLATGLSTCITKDGQTTPTANIPMGTFKFTNLGNGSAATDSATLGQVQASTTKLVTVTGTDTIAGTMNPALTAYASGQMFYFIAAGANTGAVTLNIDGLGARNVTRDGSTALAANDILSGEVALVVYDGTRFQLLNPANAGSMTVSNLTVTGTTTLSGLTASTALALDASKNVVSVTNTGTGNNVLATSPTLVTPTLGAASATSVAAGLGAVGTPSYTFTGDLNTGLWSPAADTLAASTGGSERLRVDSSGNVGIGTASPAAKLDVVGTAQVSGNFTLPSAVANGVAYLDGSKVVTSGSVLAFDGTSLRVGGSGSGSRLVVRGTGTTSATFSIEAATSGGATRFLVADDGLCRWYGTSNAETMRLDNAGNLGIGTASPGTRLEVTGDITQTWATAMDRFVGSKFSTTYELGLHFLESSRETRVLSKAADSNDKITFYTGTTPTERMRLDTSGNLGIGTASPSVKLHVSGSGTTQAILASGDNSTVYLRLINSTHNGGYLGYTSDNLTFLTGSTERMRLDSSGNLGIGTASPGARLEVSGSLTTTADVSGLVTVGRFSAGFPWSLIRPSSDSSGFEFRSHGGTQWMRLTSDGNVVAGSGAALATTATNGFLYVPTCAGTPTGTPTAITGMAPIVVDTTNNKMYFYSGGQWRDAGP